MKKDQQRNKRIRIRVAGILLLVLALAAFVFPMQKYYLRRIDQNELRIQGFYLEDDHSLDVVFIGASDVYSSVYSADLYRLTGITSYPYSFQDNPVTMWKYELREILAHQTPKVLIVDLNGICYDEERLRNEASVRILADNIPHNENFRELIDTYGTDEKASYYFPFLKYHGEAFNFHAAFDIIDLHRRGQAVLKGAFTHSYSKKLKEDRHDYYDGTKAELDPLAESCLREFLEQCQGSGIEHILFARFPERYEERTVERYHRYNRAAEIVEEYGFEYVDFQPLVPSMGIVDEDWYNYGHLNANGAEKFTVFFSSFLTGRYGLGPTELTDSQRQAWDESADYIRRFYALYKKYRKENPDAKDDRLIFKEDHATMKQLEKMGPA